MKINQEYLMTQAEGEEMNRFKADLGPIYPGYDSFPTFMNYVRDKLIGYGCVDITEHHWTHNTHYMNIWDRDAKALGLSIDGKELTVATAPQCSQPTGEEGLTAPMMFYDYGAGEPAEGAFAGKIVVMTVPKRTPEKPYPVKFLESFTVTDCDLRTPPLPHSELLEDADPEDNNSYDTRWDFMSWMTMIKYAKAGKAAGLIVCSSLPFGTVDGLLDRQRRFGFPAIVVDRTVAPEVIEAAKACKDAHMKVIAKFFDTDTWNFFAFQPGMNYGKEDDEYVTVNVHTDAMSLVQDNGALGAIGVARYFSHIPQSERKKTIVYCIDSRHFIEGAESGNMQHDPYKIYPEIAKKVVVTVGMEHMGAMETRNNYAANTMEATGLPDYSFMTADDNDWAVRTLLDACLDSGIERVDVRVAGRAGLRGKYKGIVRAVQAKTHQLGVCVMGMAGNWCGGHTQVGSRMQYFGPKKFRDEVHVWTQVVANLVDTDSIVYDIAWNNLNKEIRQLAADGKITDLAKESQLYVVSEALRNAEEGEYKRAVRRLELNLVPILREIAGADADAAETAAEVLIKKLEAKG